MAVENAPAPTASMHERYRAKADQWVHALLQFITTSKNIFSPDLDFSKAADIKKFVSVLGPQNGQLPEQDAEGRPLPAQQTKLASNSTKHVSDSLLVLKREVFHEYERLGDQTGLSYAAYEFDESVTHVRTTRQPPRDDLEEALDDSSDDDLFGSANKSERKAANRKEQCMQTCHHQVMGI